jgi:hypothetical protein
MRRLLFIAVSLLFLPSFVMPQEKAVDSSPVASAPIAASRVSIGSTTDVVTVSGANIKACELVPLVFQDKKQEQQARSQGKKTPSQSIQPEQPPCSQVPKDLVPQEVKVVATASASSGASH